MRLGSKQLKPSSGFLVTVAVLLVLAIAGRPIARWTKAQYDLFRASTTTLTATETEYNRLLATIQAQQSPATLERDRAAQLTLPEKIFQTALARDLLGRSSQYEPYTHNGRLACAWMVNMLLQRAIGDRVGENPLYVPSMVAALDRGIGRKIPQTETQRGDLAIANGTDYERGLWHIGICMNDGCRLVLSNSPVKSRFDWLTNANFDQAFAHYPGETTFYRVVKTSVP